MNGEIGVLYQDSEQVGGVYDWEIEIFLESVYKNDWLESKVHKHLVALSYWMVKVPDGEFFDIEFYKIVEGHLVLMNAGKVTIRLPDTWTLNRRLYAPLNIVWREPFEDY